MATARASTGDRPELRKGQKVTWAELEDPTSRMYVNRMVEAFDRTGLVVGQVDGTLALLSKEGKILHYPGCSPVEHAPVMWVNTHYLCGTV